MKIAVYAISKDEENFAERWYESMKEADEIYVTDTGSKDNTVEILKELGAKVTIAEIKPWRFDTARNISLEALPDDVDICVCTDLDEYFSKGWRKALEDAWTKGVTTRARYKYTWSFNDDNTPGVTFWYEKIHARHGFKWTHPVHEILEFDNHVPDIYTTAVGVELEHHPDNTKSREQYLGLLELSVKENPNDDRNVHYLGREYMFKGRWDDSISTLKHHLALPSAKWIDERSASMRYIARCYTEKNDLKQAEIWLYRAIAEAPHMREGYIELAKLYYRAENWCGVYHMIQEALKIEKRPETYINEGFCWDYTVYDLISIAAYNMGLFAKSLEYARKALSMKPDSKRLQDNIEIIKEAVF